MKSFGLARIGRDVELRYGPKGDPVASLNLAFPRRVNGEKATQWVDAALWGKRAESLAPYLKKGGLVVVTLEDVHIETYQSKTGEGYKLAGRVMDIELAGGTPQGQEEMSGKTPEPQAKAKLTQQDIDDSIPF